MEPVIETETEPIVEEPVEPVIPSLASVSNVAPPQSKATDPGEFPCGDCDFIAKNKLSERVIFLRGLSLEEMAIIYQSAEIMIYPSIFEGFGIPILEALFSKTPVITSEGGCFCEAGGPYSKYINPLSVSDIKEAIIEIQNSSELQSNMAEKGFEYAQNFTDNNIATNLMEVYTNL